MIQNVETVPKTGFNGVKVFSATKAKDREMIGDVATDWIGKLLASGGQIIDSHISQSSDSEFHCLSLVFFYKKAAS